MAVLVSLVDLACLASMLWPKSLANITLTKALYKDNGIREESANGWKMTRYKFFLICFSSMFVYFWVPKFPVQSPRTVQLGYHQATSPSPSSPGLHLVPTMDWNIATYLGDPIVTPFFTLMNYVCGMSSLRISVLQ
ncbi:OPT oligopeptide transporter protein-domain-containing protein [Fusarium flagelliforme]|uniref:OPT oligopeptide transporter protein-domain-containing protein n=1 Tax=Fusarium flagelliforme TaxID=2675880 RepID=UPI001E8E80B0|nr:OPT oligopeptide transporter protein-domain-containing protein [Fusarium flagelliforme]KAH7188224.1 OPT oligopeptide transporter protein-domain-containing protein [Fusarium flagelliforme]